ncbi:MAG: hypothetical protein U9R15_05820 [Chloroflexota bacterium]|nr:hypothetical protein [Chloroflexota bacterium]
MRTPQWDYDNLTLRVLSYVETYPGLWTARLCRLINDLPENERSVIHCGLCSDYANPRKRKRAAQYAAHPTLPGFSPQYQLHPPCFTISLRQLQGILRKLRDQCLMVLSEEQSRIPDSRNGRGWDLATRWYPFP